MEMTLFSVPSGSSMTVTLPVPGAHNDVICSYFFVRVDTNDLALYFLHKYWRYL